MCLLACVLFTIIMVGGVLWKKEAFLHEYAPAVQEKFLKENPQYQMKPQTQRTAALAAAKVLMSVLFVVLLSAMVYAAGARAFLRGAGYAYIIWFVVNWYDVFALDMGVFAHWKKVRLTGTEDMDEAYVSNHKKHVKDGFFGMVLGIPLSCICGIVVMCL